MEPFTEQLWLSSDLRRHERANKREHERERDVERIECVLGVPALGNARRGTSPASSRPGTGSAAAGIWQRVRSVPQQNWAVLMHVV